MSAPANLKLEELLPLAGESSATDWARHTWSEPRFPGALLRVRVLGGLAVYAIAETQATWRRLRPLLWAFVGRSFSDFEGKPHVLNSAIPLEAKLASSGIAVVARLASSEHKNLDAAFEALVRGVLSAGEVTARRMDPTSVLLSRFHGQVLVGDRRAALATLAEIRAGLRVDSLNLGFLEVALYDQLRDWRALRAMADFETLCRTRRSQRTTLALLNALYWVEIEPHEDRVVSPRELVTRYETSVRALTAPLLGEVPPSAETSVGSLRLRALECAATGVPWTRSDVMDELLGPTFAGLVPLPPFVEVPPQPVEAKAEAPPALGLLDLLLRAVQMESLEALHDAIQAWDELSDDERLEWQTRPWASSLIDDIRRRAGGQAPPTDWLQWFARLDEPEFERALDLALEGSEQWSTAALDDEAHRRALASAIEMVDRRSTVARLRLEGSLTHLVAWLRRDPQYPRSLLIAVYQDLFLRLAAAARRHPGVIIAAEDLLDAILASNPTPEQYGASLYLCQDLLEDYLSPSTVDAVLSIAECMVRHPCADGDARQSTWAWFSAELMTIRSQLDVAQMQLVSEIEKRILGPEAIPEWTSAPAKDDLAKILRGKKVGLYTLTPGAGQQAKAIIMSCAPTASVVLRQDKVCTRQLKEAARTMDIFVIATRSASHAATDCIHAARGSAPVRYARGRGVSSLLAALLDD